MMQITRVGVWAVRLSWLLVATCFIVPLARADDTRRARAWRLLEDGAHAAMTGERKSGGAIAEQMDELKEPKQAVEFAFEQGVGFVPYAAAALAQDPDPRSGAALDKALQDKNWIVRVAALRAIAARGNKASSDQVETAMQDKRDEVRFAASVAALKLTQESK